MLILGESSYAMRPDRCLVTQARHRLAPWLAALVLLLALGPRTAGASAQPTPSAVGWLQTVRDTPLWSGPDAQATVFSTLPAGSFVRPEGGDADGRLSIAYTGDGETRLPGPGWVARADLGPSGPPPWIATSELDGDAARAAATAPVSLHRVAIAAPPATTARTLAVVDDGTGLLLYGLDPHAPEPPASTTKIATALVALDHLGDDTSLDDQVQITVDGWAMAQADGSSIMGLQPGTSLSLRTLLYGMMLPSGNDAAEQVAVALGGSRAQYIDWMNQEAATLGLQDTHFANPSGMDEDGHYSSAYDMAMLARYAMRNETFRTLSAATSYTGDGFGPMRNLNRLLGTYRGADGVKIGYTDNAHKTFVASVVRDGHRVFVSLMHSEDLVTDSTRLFDWVWDNYTWP
jgi:D-alanyl-D-alanine carboxypeptidase